MISDIFVLVDGGEVDDLVTSPNPTLAEVFFLPTIAAEFPINWCIRSDAFEVSVRSVFFMSCVPYYIHIYE